MKYTLNLEVECDSEEKAINLFKVLKSEKTQEIKKNQRSNIILEKKENSIIFKIDAKDSTALRAALNGITTNLQIFEKTLKLND